MVRRYVNVQFQVKTLSTGTSSSWTNFFPKNSYLIPQNQIFLLAINIASLAVVFLLSSSPWKYLYILKRMPKIQGKTIDLIICCPMKLGLHTVAVGFMKHLALWSRALERNEARACTKMLAWVGECLAYGRWPSMVVDKLKALFGLKSRFTCKIKFRSYYRKAFYNHKTRCWNK